ncbi:MAG: hypothetical protein K2V38_03785 [Gemmataceae bacterium]|nr:hypothetical protein [Gemmataceae bacterium]
MLVRSLAIAVLAATVAFFNPAVGFAADDDENPYKSAKVGDFSNYKMTMKVAGLSIDGTMTQTVTAKTDKEATIKVTGVFELMGNKMDIPAQEQKIDLTKPYDPTKGNIPGGAEAKVEKGKEGKEKIKVGGKEYEATWTTYKVNMKQMGQDVDADMKVWSAKGVPLIKMTMTAKFAGQDMEMALELTETGNKKPEKDK